MHGWKGVRKGGHAGTLTFESTLPCPYPEGHWADSTSTSRALSPLKRGAETACYLPNTQPSVLLVTES